MAVFRLRILAFCAVCLALGMNTAWGQSRVRGIERGAVDLPAITKRASMIIRGAVTNSEVAWIGRTIYTRYDLTVTETIKGNPRQRVKMWVPGGATGQVQTAWPGAPALGPSDEIVFFGEPFETRRGRGNENQNKARENDGFTPIGLFDGCIKIETEPATGEKVVRARGRREEVEGFLTEVRGLARAQRRGR
jgi:hypothetical protein